jgi:hypothetical protein
MMNSKPSPLKKQAARLYPPPHFASGGEADHRGADKPNGAAEIIYAGRAQILHSKQVVTLCKLSDFVVMLLHPQEEGNIGKNRELL